MKWLRCLLALTFLVAGVQLMAANSSYAASDYDTVLHTTPSLYVYTDGMTQSQKMDIGQSWYNELVQTYTIRETQAGFPPEVLSELTAIRSSGSLALMMRKEPDGITVEIYGTRDPNPTCGFVGDAATGSFGCTTHPGYGSIGITYFTHNSYGGGTSGCGFWWATNTCSDNGMNIYTMPSMTPASPDHGAGIFSFSNATLAKYMFYYMKNFTVTYPPGYAGAVIPTQPPNATYVAMGDSYSSGEGNPPFEGDSDVYTDSCHRSSAAYPRLLENDATLSMGPTAFVACSGATTSTVLYGGSGLGSWGEGPQTQALSADTQIVTITVGGNDIGFSDFAKACVWPLGSSCDSSTSIYATTMGKITNDLPAALKSAYEQILTDAPNAKVYVIDYAWVTPATGMDVTDPKNNGCFYLYNGSTNWGNGRAARDVVNAINSTISNEVTTVQQESTDYASRLHYVSSNDPTSPFAGHTVCDTGNSYFQNVNQAGVSGENAAYVFHPNANGHLAYKNLVSYAITGGIA